MLNLVHNYKKKRRYIVLNEEDVMVVLNVMSKIRRNSKIISSSQHMEIASCGWFRHPEKWFMHFDMTDSQWCSFISQMEDKGYKLILKDGNDLCLIKD